MQRRAKPSLAATAISAISADRPRERSRPPPHRSHLQRSNHARPFAGPRLHNTLNMADFAVLSQKQARGLHPPFGTPPPFACKAGICICSAGNDDLAFAGIFLVSAAPGGYT